MGLIVAQALFRGVLVVRSWFFVDDHFFLAAIARGDDDIDWYLRLHNGHFMPLSFLLVKLAAELGEPYGWTIPTVQIVVLQVLASAACWWMLRTLFGPSNAALVGLTVYLTTAMTMPALMWWAVAINQLPHQIAFFGAVTSHILFARTRRVRWVGAASAFLLLGFVTYAKTGLIVITLGLLTLIWLVEGPPWDRFWSAVRRFWVAWTSYGFLSLLWLAIYLTRDQEVLVAATSDFVPLAQSMFFESFLATIVGGPLFWRPFINGPIQYVDPPLLLVVAASLALAAVVIAAWARSSRSLLILWPVALYLLASALMVFTGRAFVISLVGGGQVGIHVQYIADVAPLVVLAGVALFVPVHGVADPIRPREQPLVTTSVPRAAAWGSLAVVAAAGVYSSVSYAALWTDFPERTTTERAIATLQAADDPVLVDTFVPANVLGPGFGENALLRNHFAPIADDFSVSTAGVDLVILSEGGHLVPADVFPPEGLEEPELPEIQGCEPVTTSGTEFEAVPLPAFGLWVAVEYRSEQDDVLSVGGIGTTRVGLEAPRGRHRLLVETSRPGETVTVTARDGGSLCVTRVEYGQVRSP